jgi:hypothetical protein
LRDVFIDSKNKKRKNIIVLRHVLKFTRLAQRPGLEQSHTAHRKMKAAEGDARVDKSKALVEANENIMLKAR